MHKRDTVYKILLLVKRSYRSSIATLERGEQANKLAAPRRRI
jgi:hypothetical protein